MANDAKFLLISEATASLEAGMFGGSLNRPEPVKAAKKHHPRASIGWGGHKQAAATTINAAATSGDLRVFVFASSDPGRSGHALQVPLPALSRLTRIRGGLPDHPVRPSITLVRDGFVTSELFAALSHSAMYLQKDEFRAWYEKQKSRGRWPSQRTRATPRIGRPSKQTNELRTSIIARVEEGSWSASEPVAKLAALLIAREAPKRNTLKRAVDQLYEETGDPRLRLVPRKRSNASSKNGR